MKFEEEFPSLKDSYSHRSWVEDMMDEVIHIVPIQSIQEHCIDKQRLKDVIDKIRDNISRADSKCFRDSLTYVGDDALDELEKELGLKE